MILLAGQADPPGQSNTVKLMRYALTILLVAGLASAQVKIPPRFGIDADLDKYPQKTAQDSLRSVLKGIEGKRVDYVLAHLAEPTFVDERVKQTGGKFEIMVRETTEKLDADPEMIRDLRKLLADGQWKVEEGTASVTAAEVKGRAAFFRKIGDRWFFENRVRADTKGP
ncbi:MAG: hypothetical protein K1X57_05010 [Gemmataceae bacterium]|nr:hypothetical protein [Gemmataceae bacterium]